MSRIIIPQPNAHSSRPLGGRQLDPSLPTTPVAPPHATNPQQIMLVGAPNAQIVSYQDVCSIRPPEVAPSKTREESYFPLPWARALDGMRDKMSYLLDKDPVYECYALGGISNKDISTAKEVSGIIAWKSSIKGVNTVALYQGSYNKQIANTFGVASASKICANGSMWAPHMLKCRSTANVETKAVECINGVMGHIEEAMRIAAVVEEYRQIPMTHDFFSMYLGLLLGRGIITPRIMSGARKYWEACHDGKLHDEHGDNSLYSAYQAVTGAGRSLRPRSTLNMYAGLSHVTGAVAASGGSINPRVIPEFTLEVKDIDDLDN